MEINVFLIGRKMALCKGCDKIFKRTHVGSREKYCEKCWTIRNKCKKNGGLKNVRTKDTLA